MWAAIRRILGAMARMVVVTTLECVDGIWRLVQRLGPQRDTGMLDEAEMFLGEAPAPVVSPTTSPLDELAARRVREFRSEGLRAKTAAKAMIAGEQVSKADLDRDLGGDRQILEWLDALTSDQLAVVAAAAPDLVDMHLAGPKCLPVPTPSEAIEAANILVRLEEPAMTMVEWKLELMRRVGEQQSDRYDFNALIAEATFNAKAGFNIEMARQYRLAEAKAAVANAA